MAITPTYEHDTKFVKISLGSETYYLADADLRDLVETFGNAVFADVATSVEEGNEGLAKSKDVAAAIEEAIKDLPGAMHFRGVVVRQTGETDAQAIARAITDPKSGDVVILKDNKKEYIYDGAAWNELGDEGIYLTKAEAASTYVTKTTTIAGIDLQDNITAEELSAASALDLKALAHKASASGSIEVIDSIEDITVGEAGTYDVTSTPVSVPATYSALDVTPSGSIEIEAVTAAAATYKKVSAITTQVVEASETVTGNYTPEGSVTLPSITVTNGSLTKEDVAVVTDSGTEYSITAGSVNRASDTSASFVKKGYKISVTGDDNDTLKIEALTSTDTEYLGNAVTAVGEVTYTAPTLTGNLPTFGTRNVVTAMGQSTASYASPTADLNGKTVAISSAASFEDTAATVTQPTFEGSFTGDTKTVTPAVATTVSAAGTNGQVTVAEGTRTLETSTTTKTVTVQ